MNSLLKIAVSSLVLATALMGNSAGSASDTASPRIERNAARFAAGAEGALRERDGARAIDLAEQAVGLNPRNAQYRALLGQAYLAAGRFASAATAFRDAIALSPADGRSALSLALAETAQGRNGAALDALAQARGLVPDADYGLGLALAGDRAGAVAVLEAAARVEGATAKARQNLALAYALDGRWKESHSVAAQDVPADELPARLAQWAQFARPHGISDQVASLLGVSPAADPGQPDRLALAPAAPAVAEPVAIASVAPAPANPDPVRVEEQPVPAAVPLEETPALAEAKVRAAQSILMAAPAVEPAPAPIMRKANPRSSKPVMQVAAARPRPAKRGNFVVQLGAFSSASRVEAAWDRLNARSRLLNGYSPSSMKFVPSGQAAVYRLSVGGFATRAEASELCRRIRAGGGECFVRGVAGDAPLQWVSRAKGERYASR